MEATTLSEFLDLDSLDDDSLGYIFISLSGPPPAQALTLARIRAVSTRFRFLADHAAEILVADHMDRAHRELDVANAEYARLRGEESAVLRDILPEALDFDLRGPVDAAGSALQALLCSIPKLPLQWTALRNSITNLSVDVLIENVDAALPPRQTVQSAGLTPINTRGAIGFTWEVETSPTVMRRRLSDPGPPVAPASGSGLQPLGLGTPAPTAAISCGRGGGEEWEGGLSPLSMDDTLGSRCGACDDDDGVDDDFAPGENPYARGIAFRAPTADQPADGPHDLSLHTRFAGWLLAFFLFFFSLELYLSLPFS